MTLIFFDYTGVAADTTHLVSMLGQNQITALVQRPVSADGWWVWVGNLKMDVSKLEM